MIRYIKTFEVIFSRNNLSGTHIIPCGTVGMSTNTFVCLVYSIPSLVQTLVDHRNIFAISGIRINRCLKWYEGFEKNRKVFVLTVL